MAMYSSQPELSFLRLLDRTKKLAREDLASNVWKVNAAVLYLENLLSKLQDSSSNADGIRSNGILSLLEAETCVSSRPLTYIPKRCVGSRSLMMVVFVVYTTKHGHRLETTSCRLSKATNELRVRNRTVYRADLRKQLLGQERQRRRSGMFVDFQTLFSVGIKRPKINIGFSVVRK
uniref:Vesicle transport protein USE1 n=1 Tax=Angiostrongylus cantonensis TaxID=6313 RepID=A0A0K0DMY5_ANGCA